MVLAQLAKHLPDSFSSIFPKASTWVDSLGKLGFAKFIQSIFAQIEVLHVMGLLILSAAVIITCLRLIGVGLTEEPPSVVEKNTRIFLHIGVVLAIVSGLLIGMSNASKLYNSSVFTVKMMAMVAAVIFSYFVMVPVAKAEGQAGTTAKIGAVIALALWLFAMLTFSVKPGSNPGVFHVLCAGALIVFFALQGRLRWIFLWGAVAIVVIWNVLTHIVITDDMDHDKYMMVNHTFMLISTAWVFGLSFLNIFGKGAATGSNAFARMTGYATILMWVTVGACGRWIGLS